MNNVDVLAELRVWRDEFARSHGYDIHVMAKALRELDSTSERTVVHGEPRRPVTQFMPKQSQQPTGADIVPSPLTKPLEVAPAAERQH